MARSEDTFEKWQSQFRRGYLELCVLTLVDAKGKIYGFEMMTHFEKAGLNVTEGTLYPLLARLTNDRSLASMWETPKSGGGHPRKFYSLSPEGKKALEKMQDEYKRLNDVFKKLK